MHQDLAPTTNPASRRRAANPIATRSLWRHLAWVSPFGVVGVLVPLLAVTWLMSTRVVSFDGALNMQVARHIADLGSYSRTYGETTLFPAEIQTSSYFLFVSAAAIRVFGFSNLSLQAGNLLFVALLLLGFMRLTAPSRIASLTVPSVAILCDPGLLAYSTGGYGEGAATALALVAFMLLAGALRDTRHVVALSAGAFACVGVAISIKTVAFALLPAALLGLLIVGFAGRRQTTRARIFLTPLATLVPIIAFELYRLAVLGRGYGAYWKEQVSSIAYQAGIGADTDPSQGPSLLGKIADHFHLLAQQTGIAAEWWVFLLALAPVGLATVSVLAWRGWHNHERARERQWALLALLLTVFAEYYFVWWLAITPTEKAWLRRATIGIFALLLAVGLVAALAISLLRRSAQLTLPVRAAAGLVAVLSVLAVAFVGWPTAGRTYRSFTTGASAEAGLVELAGDVDRLSDDGAQFYGIGWWSAPVVSLYSGVDFGDLYSSDICSPEALEAFSDGDAYLVWDFYAEALSNTHDPSWGGATFTPTDVKTSYGQLWRITLNEAACRS